MNTTAYAKRTLYKPIDFFFRGVVEASGKSKKVAFVDAFQILNDRYLGRMSVCNYFYIAENSVRINELNIIALEELVNYDLVMRENFLIPDNLTYCLPITTRFLDNDKDFDVLMSTLKDLGYKKSNLIISFFVCNLVGLDEEGRKRYNRLRKAGYKICAAAFGEDYNALDVLADFNFDYLRCEASYFDTAQNKKKVLAMLVSFCKSNKIGLIMEGVDSPSQYTRFKKEGIKLLTGRAVSKLSRWVTNEFLYLKDPVGEKKEQYLKKLQKVLDAKEKEVASELEALRQDAIEKEKQNDADRVMPTTPRPELAKSPYQVRLEQQRQNARKATEERLIAQAKLIEQDTADAEDSKLMSDMSRMRFEGDVQSALALSFASQKKSELGVDRKLEDKPEKPAKEKNAPKDEEQKAEEPKAEEKKETVVTQDENSVSAPVRPPQPEIKVPKKPKKIKADFDKEEKLYNEYKSDSMFGGLGMDMGMSGFGVTMRIESKSEDEPELIGKYNEKGQWVDEDGNVFNGYFDVEGNWVEYEQFDVTKEGSYNDKAQWVDKDGNVYDGYFDEEGRWIDYTYTDLNGEIVDNGYFDDTIGKWVPYGYFAGDGTYHKF